MHPFFAIAGGYIPAYGLIITLGSLMALTLGLLVAKHRKLDTNNYCALCGYGLLGGMVGAKLFYILTWYQELDFLRIFDPIYSLSLVHPSGFVVIGGLIGGAITMAVSSKLHNLKAQELVQNLIFVLPLCQCFGRIGCFMAGCCYGISYEGFGAVSFPHYSFAGAVSRFPVQLLSSGLLFLCATILYFISRTKYKRYSIYFYIFIYSILRFLLEFLRGDYIERGVRCWLSPSQLLCLICLVLLSLVLLFKCYLKRVRLGAIG